MLTAPRRSLVGAWIEIRFAEQAERLHIVAPLWERGLKFKYMSQEMANYSRSLVGAWIEISL